MEHDSCLPAACFDGQTRLFQAISKMMFSWNQVTGVQVWPESMDCICQLLQAEASLSCQAHAAGNKSRPVIRTDKRVCKCKQAQLLNKGGQAAHKYIHIILVG